MRKSHRRTHQAAIKHWRRGIVEMKPDEQGISHSNVPHNALILSSVRLYCAPQSHQVLADASQAAGYGTVIGCLNVLERLA